MRSLLLKPELFSSCWCHGDIQCTRLSHSVGTKELLLWQGGPLSLVGS